MANSLLHDDIVALVEPIENTQEAVVALLNSVADRIENSRGNDGMLTQYVKSLRDGSDEVTNAILANVNKEDRYHG